MFTVNRRTLRGKNMLKHKLTAFAFSVVGFFMTTAPALAQNSQTQSTGSNNRLQQILNLLMKDQVKEAADLMNFTTFLSFYSF